MRLVAIAISVTLTLLSGCDHMGGAGRGFGHAASGFVRTTEHAASGIARVAAPIATRIARAAPVIARDAIVVAAITAQLGQAASPPGEAGASADEPGAPAGKLTTDVTHNAGGADPCRDCPSDETCFYVDYVCPATTASTPIDP